MERENYFFGTELKIAISIECEGFSMDNDEWTATVKRSGRSIVCDKAHNTAHDQDGWYLLIDSSLLGTGAYVLVVDIEVPDADFEDGFRHETYKKDLFFVQMV